MKKTCLEKVLIVGLICFFAGAAVALWAALGIFTRAPEKIIALLQTSVDKLVDIVLAIAVSMVFTSWYGKRKEIYDRLYVWTSNINEEIEHMTSASNTLTKEVRLAKMEGIHLRIKEALMLTRGRRRYILYRSKLKKTEQAVADYIRRHVEGLFDNVDAENVKLKEIRDLAEQLTKSFYKAA